MKNIGNYGQRFVVYKWLWCVLNVVGEKAFIKLFN